MKNDDLIPAIIIQADMAEAEASMTHAELRNAMKRHQERMAKYKGWVDPEAIKLRWAEFEKASAAALERGKRMGRELELLPVPDPLPKHMVGQSASAIQAMLRSGWEPEEFFDV